MVGIESGDHRPGLVDPNVAARCIDLPTGQPVGQREYTAMPGCPLFRAGKGSACYNEGVRSGQRILSLRATLQTATIRDDPSVIRGDILGHPGECQPYVLSADTAFFTSSDHR